MTTSGWALRRIADPIVEPITIDDAREQCEIDADLTRHDAKLTQYIKAARELAESYTRRTFVESTWRISAANFVTGCSWSDAGIELPMGPIIRINSVTYLDNDGTRTPVATENWQLLDDEEPAQLYPAYNTLWPYGRVQPGAAQIEYVAGYQSAGSPADAVMVPEVAKQAIRMLVAHWFANRENATNFSLSDVPYGFERVLDSIRIYP